MIDALEHWQGRPVLVTGGGGAIGSQLCLRLVDLGAHVAVIDDFSAGPRTRVPDSVVEFLEGDILDERILDRAFAFHPTIIFHLAAAFASERSVSHPVADLLSNGLGTLRLLERARQAATERFVYSSSSCVYGSEFPLPLTEPAASLMPDTPYQATKLLGELYANYFSRTHGLPVVVLRLFNVYGPGEIPGADRNVIPNFIAAALDGETIRITGDGDESRDFTYIDDIVEAMLLSGWQEGAVGRTINIGTGIETTIRDLAILIADLTGSPSTIALGARRHWDRTLHRRASRELAHGLLGWEPRWDLPGGLRETIRWIAANRVDS